jgi:hypothetical protein
MLEDGLSLQLLLSVFVIGERIDVALLLDFRVALGPRRLAEGFLHFI